MSDGLLRCGRYRLTIPLLAAALLVLSWCAAGAAPAGDGRGNTMPQPPAADHPPGLALANVPSIGFFEPTKSTTGTEECPLPSLLRACLQCAGETPPGGDWHRAYLAMMGASGAAFRLLWDPGSRVCYAMLDVNRIAADPTEPARRACEAMGRSAEVLLRGEPARAAGYTGPVSDDEALYRARIIESIRAGRPAIALGMPRPALVSLVVGYDEDGAALLARPFLHRESAGEAGLSLDALGNVRKRDWFGEVRGILVVGEPVPPASPRELHRRALLWALQVMRTPEVRGLASGLAAYDAWADSLVAPPAFKEDAPETAEAYRTHRITTFQMCEARLWAAEFLRQVAAEEPAAKGDLLAAAGCFDAAHDAAWEIGAATSFHWLGEELKRFCTPWRRERMATLLRGAKTQEEQAAVHIERALARL